MKLDLVAITPAGSTALERLAQPFGADSLKLTVTVSGILKDGGTLNFMASDIKPNHPTKPLAIAQTLFNAMGDGAEFEAVLSLDFGSEGRFGLHDQIKKLSEDAPDEIAPKATFDKPIESKT